MVVLLLLNDYMLDNGYMLIILLHDVECHTECHVCFGTIYFETY
jgi:hypothetical protein